MHTTAVDAFALATRYHAAGQLALAEPFYQAVLAIEPNHPEVLLRLGVIALQQGNPALARDYLRRAVAGDGATAVIWNNLGVAYTTVGDGRDAVAAYEQALRLRPDYAEAYNNLGVAWLHLGDPKRAAGCCEQAIRYLPAYPEAYDNLGTVLEKSGAIGRGGRRSRASAAAQTGLRHGRQ